jgi:hypothetical protein
MTGQALDLDDLARALGHLVPDAVAAIFTAGTGTAATRGAKGTADAIDALSDISKSTRAIDDVEDLCKGDGLDDFGKLDNGDLSRLDDLDAPGVDDLTPDELGDVQLYTGFGTTTSTVSAGAPTTRWGILSSPTTSSAGFPTTSPTGCRSCRPTTGRPYAVRICRTPSSRASRRKASSAIPPT